MSKVKATLALGALLLAGVGAYTLTRSPVRVVAFSGKPQKELGVTIGDLVLCQPGEVLPAGATAVRLPLIAFYGANVKLIAFKGGHVLTSGSRGPTWTGVSVTVPVRPLASTVTGATVCFGVAPNSEPVHIPGDTAPRRETAVVLSARTLTPAALRSPARHVRGRLTLEYVGSGHSSWWSRILTVARHVGLGRAYSGTWIALLLAALMLLVAGLAARLTLKEVQ